MIEDTSPRRRRTGDAAVAQRGVLDFKLTFGDDSEMSREEKRLFVDVYDRFGIRIDWRIGDVVVFCNYRFAHGRPGIHLDSGEERELGVLIGEAFERVGDLPGKW